MIGEVDSHLILKSSSSSWYVIVRLCCKEEKCRFVVCSSMNGLYSLSFDVEYPCISFLKGRELSSISLESFDVGSLFVNEWLVALVQMYLFATCLKSS